MNQIINLIDKYMTEIVVASVIGIVLLFLVRSFKRTMLIENGQMRFVVEQYDVNSAKLYKRLFILVLFLILPILTYVKLRFNFL